MSRLLLALFLSCLFVSGSRADQFDPVKFVKSAREQIGITVDYDGSYQRLQYPGGDVPIRTGVCTDVLIRAFRAQGTDLQQLVHEDMRANFAEYPGTWGLKRPDPNIDHRRVPNLMKFLARRGHGHAVSRNVQDYRPGDVVAWDLGKGVTHIGIVSDRSSADGVPLVIHNIGAGVQEEDILFRFQVIGFYRVSG